MEFLSCMNFKKSTNNTTVDFKVIGGLTRIETPGKLEK